MHSLGLKSDGSIEAWGRNNEGQCDVPVPNEDFVSIAARWGHSLGIKGHPRQLGDLDGDGDVDYHDLALFQEVFTGPR